MTHMGIERRTYIRHPSDIPFVYDFLEIGTNRKENLRDISVGGVSFRTNRYIENGTTLSIRIDLVHPTFEGTGVVVWCRHHGDHYDVGVQFVDENTSFRARMVEQICHIERYKREILAREGRNLSGEEAATEWIKKYAKDFPR